MAIGNQVHQYRPLEDAGATSSKIVEMWPIRNKEFWSECLFVENSNLHERCQRNFKLLQVLRIGLNGHMGFESSGAIRDECSCFQGGESLWVTHSVAANAANLRSRFKEFSDISSDNG